MEPKLDVTGTIRQAFSIYGAQAKVLIPAALGLFLIVAVVNGLVAGTLLLVPLGLAVGVVANTLFVGMVVLAVSNLQAGQSDFSVGNLISAAKPVILPLIGAGILAGIGIGFGILLFVIPGLFLMTIWSVIGPVIVLERVGVFKSFGRSHELVRGDAWRVFGVIVIVAIIVIVVRSVLAAIAVGIDDSVVARILFDWIGSSLTAPISAIVATVIYFHLLVVKAGGAPAPVEPGPATV